MSWVILVILISIASFVIFRRMLYKRYVGELKEKIEEFFEMFHIVRKEIGSNGQREYKYNSKNYTVIMWRHDYMCFWIYINLCALDILNDYDKLKNFSIMPFLKKDNDLEEAIQNVCKLWETSMDEIIRNDWI